MEVLSRPKVSARPPDMIDDEPTPGPSMLAAPSSATRSPPRLPSADHKLTIPARPSIASRRHSTTTGSMSPSHLSRPLRSSPLAGPSIAATNDGSLIAAASAPPTPGGGHRHLSPLAESSNTVFAETAPTPAADAETKRLRRRTLGSVLSKLSFPSASPGSSSEPASPAAPAPRPRTKSMTSQEAAPPPVPPVPTWAHNSLPARVRSPHAAPSPTAPSPPRAQNTPTQGTRPTSPTPSSRSASSSIKHASASRRKSLLPPPASGRTPEDNWLTQSAAPRFSRLGLKAEGVILPVSAKEARRRSTASLASLASASARSFDTLPPPPMPARTSSRASTASAGSLALSPSRSPDARPSTAPASQQHFRSRASSRASLASAASGYGSVYCDTPSLTMSPGPSASDVSLDSHAATVDEMGVLYAPGHVELQLNDVPVGVLSLPSPAYTGKGKARATDMSPEARDAELGAVAPWTRSAGSPTSSAATSVVDLSARAPALHGRAATAPELLSGGKEKGRRTHALGRMWKQVVRSVTTRR